jgi:putative aldouronate transport system substrate-binding protein
MKKRQLMAFLLAVIMVAALAVGCASPADTPAPTGGGDTPAAGGDTPATGGDDPPAASGDLDEVTLRFYFFDTKRSATDEVWDAIGERFKPELNANFDVQFIAGSDYADRILTMAAAGEEWDLNFDGDWLSYFRMANLGAYMPLNDLMPTYAPDLFAAYQQSGVLGAATVAGNIVAMPWGNIMNNRPYFMWRGDLFEANPGDVNTIDDVERILYEMKEMYPDKYIVENASREAFFLKHNMIEFGNNFAYDASSGTITAQHYAVTEAYRERAQYAEKWQNDGLIWADVLLDNLDHNVLINQGQLITKFGTYEFSRSQRAWIEPDAHWGFAELYPSNFYQNRTALANLVAIPRSSQNAARTLMFLNLLEINQELYDLVHYGIEGLTYEINDDGSARFPDGMDPSNSNFMLWQGRWGLWKPQFMRGDFEFPRGFWAEEKAHAERNPSNIVSALDGFNFDPEAVVVEMSQIAAIFEASEEMLDVGLAGDANAAIDKLIADMEAAGLGTVTAEMQKQVDAFLGS